MPDSSTPVPPHAIPSERYSHSPHTDLQELLDAHLHALDAGEVAAIDLRRLPLLVADKVADVVVLPVAQPHRTALAVAGIVVGGYYRLVAGMELVRRAVAGA